MIYVGLDVHARNFSVCVLDRDGQDMFERTFETSAEKLRTVVGAVAEPKQVVLEETTVAAWVYRTLDGYADKIIVADPRHNKWIAGDENIDDTSAARKLAELLRGGFIKPVHHPDPHGQAIRVESPATAASASCAAAPITASRWSISRASATRCSKMSRKALRSARSA